MQTRAEYRDWLRRELGIVPPRDQWLMWQDLGQTPDGPMPPAGAQPTDNLQILNSTLNQCIQSACNRVTIECRVPDALRWTDIPVPGQTATGPYTFRLSTLPGFAERSAVRLRRSYWQPPNGQFQPVTPTDLSQLDTQGVDYLNNGPGAPTQIAIEGDLVYLLPGPDQDGTLRLTVGSGALAPQTDLEGFDGVPSSYDEQVLYIALTEVAMIPTVDAEMRARAQSFAPLAERGLLNLTNWFDNASNDEYIANASFRTSVIRYPRRA